MVAGAKAKGLTEMVDSSHSIRGRGQMREVAGRTREESPHSSTSAIIFKLKMRLRSRDRVR